MVDVRYRRSLLLQAAGLATAVCGALLVVPSAGADPGGGGLRPAGHQRQPTAVSSHATSKQQAAARQRTTKAAAAAAATAGLDPSATCAEVTVAPGTSPAGYLPLEVFGVPPISIADDESV